MSGGDSWASTEPSVNSTNEWMTDSGWMITSICSGGRSNSQRASITSRALFISVAESTVIFGPICQVGCRRASSAVTSASSAARLAAERPAAGGQHDALDLAGAAARQRLEDGASARCPPAAASAPRRAARSMTSGPATTSVSLLARATVLPASRAAQVPVSPAAPTMAVTTTSTSGAAASSQTASVAARAARSPAGRRTGRRRRTPSRSVRTATRGRNRRHCSASSSQLRVGRPGRRPRAGRAGRRRRRGCWCRSTRWTRGRRRGGGRAVGSGSVGRSGHAAPRVTDAGTAGIAGRSAASRCRGIRRGTADVQAVAAVAGRSSGLATRPVTYRPAPAASPQRPDRARRRAPATRW